MVEVALSLVIKPKLGPGSRTPNAWRFLRIYYQNYPILSMS